MQYLSLGPLQSAESVSRLPLQPIHYPFTTHDFCLHLCFHWVLESFEKGSDRTKFQIQRTCTAKQTVGITGRTGGPIRRVLEENKREMAVEGSGVAVGGEMKMAMLNGKLSKARLHLFAFTVNHLGNLPIHYHRRP